MENTNIVYITHNKQTSLDKQNDMWQKFTNVVVRPQLDTTRRDSQNTREKTFGIKQRRKDDIRWQLGKIPANVRNISAIIFGDGTQIIFLVLIQSAQRSSVGWRWHILNTIYIYRTEKFVHIVIFHIVKICTIWITVWPYLSALEVCSRQCDIQIHVYLYLHLYGRYFKINALNSYWVKKTADLYRCSGTAAASPERGSETRPRPDTTWPCNSRPLRVALVTHRTTDRVQAVSARSQDIRRPHTRLHFRPAHTGRRDTKTLVAALLQQRQPLFSTDRAAIWRPCILCRRAPCVESVADGTESHAVIDNNIQASPKDIPVQLSTLLPMTIECIIGLTVGGALQMLLLLLLCYSGQSLMSQTL